MHDMSVATPVRHRMPVVMALALVLVTVILAVLTSVMADVGERYIRKKVGIDQQWRRLVVVMVMLVRQR